MKNDRWNKERVVLETDEGSANDTLNLLKIWQRRLKEAGISHYVVTDVTVEKGKGKKIT